MKPTTVISRIKALGLECRKLSGETPSELIPNPSHEHTQCDNS
jgi:hypothetical protein